MILWKCVC